MPPSPLWEVDHLGLDAVDRRMLSSIIRHYGGGPVGLETLAATINEEAITLEDVYEPYLMQMGFLTRTPRGRCVSQRAYEHLGLPVRAAPPVWISSAFDAGRAAMGFWIFCLVMCLLIRR